MRNTFIDLFSGKLIGTPSGVADVKAAWVSESGNDDTGRLGVSQKPFRSVTAAVAAIPGGAGYRVMVMPGDYPGETAWVKSGVDIIFLGKSTVSGTAFLHDNGIGTQTFNIWSVGKTVITSAAADLINLSSAMSFSMTNIAILASGAGYIANITGTGVTVFMEGCSLINLGAGKVLSAPCTGNIRIVDCSIAQFASADAPVVVGFDGLDITGCKIVCPASTHSIDVTSGNRNVNVQSSFYSKVVNPATITQKVSVGVVSTDLAL